jgi:phospholipid/cholesterol/gamma-HCH transport system substrate-binding protein
LVTQADRRLRLVVGSVMLLSLCGLVFGLVALGDRTITGGYVLHVDFARVDNLKEGAEVRISALCVGRVLAIRQGVVPGEPALRAPIRVDLWIEQETGHLVRKDSVFYINAAGVVGERYIEVGPPPGAPGPPAAAGQAFRGVDAPLLDRILQHGYEQLQAIAALTRELGPEIRALSAASDGLQSHLPGDLQPERLARTQGDLVALGVLASDLRDHFRAGLTRRTLARVQQLDRRLEGRLEPLIARIKAISRRLEPLQELLDAEQRERLSAAMGKLRSSFGEAQRLAAGLRLLTKRVEQGRGTVGRLIADPELVDEIKETHRILKESPWRTLARPRGKAPRGRAPRKRR